MSSDLSFSLFILALSASLTWIAAHAGVRLRRWHRIAGEEHADFTAILASTLSLLGLVIGFSFAMATNRFEASVDSEHREAQAINLAHRSADLLPQADAARVKALIARYAQVRYDEYTARIPMTVTGSQALSTEIWTSVATAAATSPTPPLTVVLNAVNAMVDARSTAVSTFGDRIPLAAWGLMIFLAVIANVILGYAAHKVDEALFVALPIALAASFFLIAEMQSPGAGVVQVSARNLEATAAALR